MATSDFDSVADRLYAGEPAAFVAERTAAARAAKEAGDVELARRIRALRKPTAAAAHINRLARAGSGPLTELAALGEQLRDAHEHLDGARLRELAHRRSELVQRIVRDAAALSESVVREVEETLEAIVADAEVARQALAGRLTSKAHHDADRWLSLPTNPAPAKKTRQSEKDRKDEEETRIRALERRHAVRARADAERNLQRAERAAEQAGERVAELRERLAEAEERSARATADLAKAQTAFEEADDAVQRS
ncbi:hypothetical protein [Amycolatopsis benzoatilytica]|uniref:hypothetical protein n=1 Tax=Amycolatopsis benzoatilytica TaxID=346045 RepID=UPI00037F39D5|nr:hypothetical protein [Amycolatopsis benzoatilytica]